MYTPAGAGVFRLCLLLCGVPPQTPRMSYSVMPLSEKGRGRGYFSNASIFSLANFQYTSSRPSPSLAERRANS